VSVRVRSRGGSPGTRWSWPARQRPELNPGVQPQPAHDAQLLRGAHRARRGAAPSRAMPCRGPDARRPAFGMPSRGR
jgi:hypothetical protein